MKIITRYEFTRVTKRISERSDKTEGNSKLRADDLLNSSVLASQFSQKNDKYNTRINLISNPKLQRDNNILKQSLQYEILEKNKRLT